MRVYIHERLYLNVFVALYVKGKKKNDAEKTGKKTLRRRKEHPPSTS